MAWNRSKVNIPLFKYFELEIFSNECFWAIFEIQHMVLHIATGFLYASLIFINTPCFKLVSAIQATPAYVYVQTQTAFSKLLQDCIDNNFTD